MAVPQTDGLTLLDITKSFGPLEALREFSLFVRRGEVVALLGPNGAGKTTLLRVAAGLLAPAGGRVLVDGIDLVQQPRLAKRKVGWAAETPQLYEHLSPTENLEFFGRLWGMGTREARAAAVHALEAAGLSHRAADSVSVLSHGMRQRLSIARALLHGPSVLLLDEPFQGLDARARASIVERLRDPKERGACAVLMATQQVDAAISACDRAAIVDRGRLVNVLNAPEVDAAALSAELRALGGGDRAP